MHWGRPNFFRPSTWQQVNGRGKWRRVIHLREVFARLRDANLKLKPRKCFICRRRVRYLGHVVTESGVEPDPDNVAKILNCAEATTLDDVKSFLGLTGYYRKFVRNYSDI